MYVLEFVLWLMLKEARGNGEDYLDCIVQLMRMFLLIVHYVVLYKYYLGWVEGFDLILKVNSFHSCLFLSASLQHGFCRTHQPLLETTTNASDVCTTSPCLIVGFFESKVYDSLHIHVYSTISFSLDFFLFIHTFSWLDSCRKAWPYTWVIWGIRALS